MTALHDDTVRCPSIPPAVLAGWIREVRELTEDVEFGLPGRSTAIRLRGLLDRLRAAAYTRAA